MVQRLTLDNGLRVVHSRMDSTVMVAVNLGYSAGARDEDNSLTGIAHLMEHLMFGGSANVAAFDDVLQRAGGSSNAWTSDDFTFYHEVLPASNLATALFLESDRMRYPAFSPRSIEVQKGVVVEEFKQQCLNMPYGDLAHHLRGMLYHSHPYRWPVIGREPGHILKASEDDIREFFNSHYTPLSAVLTVCGGIGSDEVFDMARTYFGSIPPRMASPHPSVDDPYPASEQWLEVSGKVPATRIVVAWRMPGLLHSETLAGDMLTDILANGRSSRLQRLLNESDVFATADACISGHEDSGYIMLIGQPRSEDDAKVRDAAKVLIEEARKLSTPGNITWREVHRANNRFESQSALRRMNYLELAQALTFEEFRGEDYATLLSRRRAFTPGLLGEAAGRLFDGPASVLLYRPEAR